MQKQNNIIVIKIGSAVLNKTTGGLDINLIKSIAQQVSKLIKLGLKVIIVSSGAIAAGMEAANLKQRPKKLSNLQAIAAIGQSSLMKVYNNCMHKYHLIAAQILLTRDDFSSRKRYVNAYNTIFELLYKYNAVPVINENDTIAVDEIKFGDNDTLSALVSNLMNAQKLIILTSVDGLQSSEDKKVIPLVTNITANIEGMATSKSNELGTGGMASKLQAIKLATSFGISCVVANGKKKDIILRVFKGENIGTTFLTQQKQHVAKKRWLATSPIPCGAIYVDGGAKKALIMGGKSLLAIGIKKVEGTFKATNIVRIKDQSKKEFARGMCNFSSKELSLIKGLKTLELKNALNREISQNEVVHRDNMVIL